MRIYVALSAVAVALCFASNLPKSLSAPTTVPSAPSTQPTAGLSLEFRARVTPDEAALAAGAAPFEQEVSVGSKAWTDEFTGWGCLSGPFESTNVEVIETEKEIRFFAVCERRDGGAVPKATIRWQGTIRDDQLTGELLLSTDGNARSAQQVSEYRNSRVSKIRRERAAFRADGTPANEDEVQFLLNEVQRESNLIAAQGRQLRFILTAVPASIVRFVPGSK